MSSIDNSVRKAHDEDNMIHQAEDYKKWTETGQNFELAKFAVTPVAFGAGWVAGHAQTNLDSKRTISGLVDTMRDYGTTLGNMKASANAEIDALKKQLEELRELYTRDKIFADYWVNLVKMCGSFQDGSDTPVGLGQDDATRECIITVGRDSRYGSERKRTYNSSSFEGAMRAAVAAGEAEE